MALTQQTLSQIEAVLNEMKEAGIGGGVVRKDGVVVKATIALGDIAPNIISRIANISQAMLQKEADRQMEVEVGFEGETLVIVPVASHLFFGITKNKDDKKKVMDFSKKLEGVL